MPPTAAKTARWTRAIEMSAAELDESDIQAVLAVLRSGRLALGPRTADFERAMAAYVGVRHAVAVGSGTAALHLIVKALGLGPGDEVLVPSFTFAASVNAILYEGATPVFVELEDTCNLDLQDLERRITGRTRAIMAVDVFGHPADWDGLERIGARHGLPVIDDCCEATGAAYRGRRLGSFGAAGAFAFSPLRRPPGPWPSWGSRPPSTAATCVRPVQPRTGPWPDSSTARAPDGRAAAGSASARSTSRSACRTAGAQARPC